MSMHGYVFVRECVLRDYVHSSEVTVANKVHSRGDPAAERSSHRKVCTEEVKRFTSLQVKYSINKMGFEHTPTCVHTCKCIHTLTHLNTYTHTHTQIHRELTPEDGEEVV